MDHLRTGQQIVTSEALNGLGHRSAVLELTNEQVEGILASIVPSILSG